MDFVYCKAKHVFDSKLSITGKYNCYYFDTFNYLYYIIKKNLCSSEILNFTLTQDILKTVASFVSVFATLRCRTLNCFKCMITMPQIKDRVSLAVIYSYV